MTDNLWSAGNLDIVYGHESSEVHNPFYVTVFTSNSYPTLERPNHEGITSWQADELGNLQYIQRGFIEEIEEVYQETLQRQPQDLNDYHAGLSEEDRNLFADILTEPLPPSTTPPPAPTTGSRPLQALNYCIPGNCTRPRQNLDYSWGWGEQTPLIRDYTHPHPECGETPSQGSGARGLPAFQNTQQDNELGSHDPLKVDPHLEYSPIHSADFYDQAPFPSQVRGGWPTSAYHTTIEDSRHDRAAYVQTNMTVDPRNGPLQSLSLPNDYSLLMSSFNDKIRHSQAPTEMERLVSTDTLRLIEDTVTANPRNARYLEGALDAAQKTFQRQCNIPHEQWIQQNSSWSKKYTDRMTSIKELIKWVDTSAARALSGEIPVSMALEHCSRLGDSIYDLASKLQASFDRLERRYKNVLHSKPGNAPHQRRETRRPSVIDRSWAFGRRQSY